MNIVILSNGPKNYTTKRLKESAEKRGHNVRIISYTNCYLAIDNGMPKVFYKGEEVTEVDAIIPRIAQTYTKYGTAVVRHFEMQGVFTTASSIAINRSRDKLRSYQLFSKYGVGMPNTVISRESSSFEDIIELVGGAPVIIKVARGTHGNGVVLAETKKAAKAVMQAFYVEDVSFLVQEFIEESAGTDIRALVVGGRVVAGIVRQSLDDDFRSNTHQGGVGSAAELTDEEKKTALKAAKSMGLTVCGVDMMRSDRGPLVLEVNSSASIKTPELVLGEDIAKKIVQYIEANAKQRNRKDKVGA
jgi:ribosomal protein S6--L-glutamate ligase